MKYRNKYRKRKSVAEHALEWFALVACSTLAGLCVIGAASILAI